MTASVSPPVANRIAQHFAPPLPDTPDERQSAWADALVAAMLFYQRQLASPVEAVAERAARAIFDLEKTRLRHGRDLAGAAAPPREPLLPPLEAPIPESPPVEAAVPAEPPPSATEAMTDEQLVDEYERTKPEAFAELMAAVRKRGEALGKPCGPDRVRTLTRRDLLQELEQARARHERTRGGKEVRQTESFRVQSAAAGSSGG